MNRYQVLTAAQMRAAEQRLFDQGLKVGDLMEAAAGAAAEWIRRLSGSGRVCVLCGPGNNGGDGYVIARRLREWDYSVQVIAPLSPKSRAASDALEAWGGPVLTSGGPAQGDVFVDCLFGSGLKRPLEAEHALLLRDVADRYAFSVAVDVPSGIATDTGELLNDKLPRFDVTLALGAWKFAHCASEARAHLGVQRLVPIGIGKVEGAARRLGKPKIASPARNAHKYSRGLCAVVSGSMPGAAILSATSAMRSGAGYTKMLGPAFREAPASLVCDEALLDEALSDKRIKALLVGPGLGRSEGARAALSTCLRSSKPIVLDADALHLLKPTALSSDTPTILTPHDAELNALCSNFSIIASGRRERAQALANASGSVVLAKGPDSYIAAPNGSLVIGPSASSWLSVAGTGDVLAGILVSRLATGVESFEAACEALWIHTEAARLCGPAFTADDLAHRVGDALSACL
ncbi:MAG: NAD(P)H-hydrate dehydratase [Pseudomonadota bacterium]